MSNYQHGDKIHTGQKELLTYSKFYDMKGVK